ncbi:MAG: hypothetical protein JWQ85_145 [Mucilaginibacter sp.]|nr:DUF1348 family protein [Mucilaginibacter sp.]MDB5125913.1 hypothetical protein [Mucilaginibacter sp.]
MEQKLPLPPFTFETATQKVQLAEDAWNSKTRNGYPWLILPIPSGATGMCLLMAGSRWLNF